MSTWSQQNYCSCIRYWLKRFNTEKTVEKRCDSKMCASLNESLKYNLIMYIPWRWTVVCLFWFSMSDQRRLLLTVSVLTDSLRVWIDDPEITVPMGKLSKQRPFQSTASSHILKTSASTRNSLRQIRWKWPNTTLLTNVITENACCWKMLCDS